MQRLFKNLVRNDAHSKRLQTVCETCWHSGDLFLAQSQEVTIKKGGQLVSLERVKVNHK